MGKKKTIIAVIAGLLLCGLIIGGVCIAIFTNDGAADRKRAEKLSAGVQREIAALKEDVPQADRDTFITVDDKVVVGFVEISSLNIRYPVLNTFNNNTAAYSLCRNGSSMPWDIEGMTIYGIDSFTEALAELKAGDIMIFEDLAGEKTGYKYVNKDVIDYGIVICNVDKSGNVKNNYMFEPVGGDHYESFRSENYEENF